MPIQRLPGNPSLERLRQNAKTLLRSVQAGVPEALGLVTEFRRGRSNCPTRNWSPPACTASLGEHPAYGGRTPYELALLNGHTEVAEILAAAAASAVLDETEAFVAACMRADTDAVAGFGPEPPARALARSPELINSAAGQRRPEAVRLLAGLGFGVNHLRRSTPLHAAAWNDDVETAATLIELGADPTIKDTEYDSTPLGWAEYGGRHQVAAYLRSLG
ncbi:ankyrin repeat domain-containing protein [Microtetraspora sp. NBRC 13810]|uniref:ankyrin repeat domain-containing protein n=1 Tax=Microtetraspora sp. NBRC 13810 TaxID=3030990 RepID=UPI0025568C9A|nr:ankyrin repeat domain-containing protein [Microtetraspora sp. NBRC 13810]